MSIHEERRPLTRLYSLFNLSEVLRISYILLILTGKGTNQQSKNQWKVKTIKNEQN